MPPGWQGRLEPSASALFLAGFESQNSLFEFRRVDQGRVASVREGQAPQCAVHITERRFVLIRLALNETPQAAVEGSGLNPTLSGLTLTRQSRRLDQEALCTASLPRHVAHAVF